MSDYADGDPKRIVNYRLHGVTQQTIVVLYERFPKESDIPEVLARINGVDVSKIHDASVMP